MFYGQREVKHALQPFPEKQQQLTEFFSLVLLIKTALNDVTIKGYKKNTVC